MATDYRIAFVNATTDELQTYIWTTSWATVGSPLVIAGMTNPAICYFGKKKVALTELTAKTVKCFSFDDTNWAQLGQTSIAFSVLGNPSVAPIYPNRIALIGDSLQKLIAYDFNNSYFSIMGNQLTVSAISVPAICGLWYNEIAYIEQSNRLLKRMKFENNDWVQIGSSLNIPSASNISITALTKNRIAFIDDTNRSLRVYDWNETTLTWSLLASGLSIPTITIPCIEAIDINKIAFFDTTIKELRTYTLTGTTWSQTGAGLSLAGATTNPNIAAFYKPFSTNRYNEVSLEGNALWPVSDY
jgi:hypothetical protein